MKITVKDLGVIKQAEFTLGELTIICGLNNTGKSYITHATYGLLDYLRSNADFEILDNMIDKLFADGSVSVDIISHKKDISKYLKDASENYSKILHMVFAGNTNLFNESALSISFEGTETDPVPDQKIRMKLGTAERTVLSIQSAVNGDALEVSLVVDKSSDDVPPRNIIKSMINDAMGEAIMNTLIPKPFLASAERTGAAIFQKELDFTRNRLLEMLGNKSVKLHPAQLLGKFSGEYPIAVRRNVDFIRDLPNITHKESFISKSHKEILASFHDIVGGEYKVSKNGEVQYIPSANRHIRLSLVESSSAVRSLLDIGFYLKHIAAPGDLLNPSCHL